MAFYTIHPREIQSICLKKRIMIVDIREFESYKAFHLKGAVSIPYSEDAVWERNFSKCRPILLYCEYGSTSLLAARRLGKKGFEVYTVIGGAKAIMKEYLK